MIFFSAFTDDINASLLTKLEAFVLLYLELHSAGLTENRISL